MPLRRDEIERVLWGAGAARHAAPDAPILPDVWLAFAADPLSAQELCLTPQAGSPAEVLLARVRDALAREESEMHLARSLARSGTGVRVRVTFRELIRALLPLSPWWWECARSGRPLGLGDVTGEAQREALALQLAGREPPSEAQRFSPSLLQLARVAGVIQWSIAQPKGRDGFVRMPAKWPASTAFWRAVTRIFLDLAGGLEASAERPGIGEHGSDRTPLRTVGRKREPAPPWGT
jgi:hypothetical protein